MEMQLTMRRRCGGYCASGTALRYVIMSIKPACKSENKKYVFGQMRNSPPLIARNCGPERSALEYPSNCATFWCLERHQQHWRRSFYLHLPEAFENRQMVDEFVGARISRFDPHKSCFVSFAALQQSYGSFPHFGCAIFNFREGIPHSPFSLKVDVAWSDNTKLRNWWMR